MTLLRSLVNGVDADTISVQDRGFLYGHSVFETMLVNQGHVLLLEAHLTRLKLGAERLSIPFNKAQLLQDIQLICSGIKQAVLRLSLTIGEGGRGYLSPSKPSCNRILSLYDVPQYPKEYWQTGITVGYANIQLTRQPVLAGLKHSNRLEQVLARSQWHESWQEALVCDEAGFIIEGTMSNVFVVKEKQLYTPDLSNCGVEGIMRDQILNYAKECGIPTHIMPIDKARISNADSVFLSNSLIGIWPVKRLENTLFKVDNITKTLLEKLTQNDAISIN